MKYRFPAEPLGKWVFVTSHLYGSLPPASFKLRDNLSAGQDFAWIDGYLDGRTAGPMHLKHEPIAQMVVECLHHGVRMRHYQMAAFVVMGNHLHTLIYPIIEYTKAMKYLKAFSGRLASRMLGLTGEPFWQPESYEYCIQNGEEFQRIVSYIENDPVEAGFVERAEDYRWSSASKFVPVGMIAA